MYKSRLRLFQLGLVDHKTPKVLVPSCAETRGFQETFVGWGERGMVQGLAGPALKQGDPYLGQADAQTRADPSQGEASAPATCTQH